MENKKSYELRASDFVPIHGVVQYKQRNRRDIDESRDGSATVVNRNLLYAYNILVGMILIPPVIVGGLEYLTK